MDIKLATDIKEILIEDGSISIPNFGGFTSAYKPAVVDAVNGQLAPPSFHIAFDANLQMNDGRLVDHIRQKYRLGSTAALEYIEAFANDMRSNFDKGEIVVLPEIGRLYRDFAHKIQFLPDSTNFNTASFGLPTIQYAPIMRNKMEVITKSSAADLTPEPQASMPPIQTQQVERPIEKSTPSVNRDATSDATPSPSFSQQETVKTPQNDAQTAQMPLMIETLGSVNSAQFPTPIDDVQLPTMQESPKTADFMDKLRENWRTWLPAVAVGALLGLLIWELNDTPTAKNTEGSKKMYSAEPNVNTSPLQSDNLLPKENTAPPVNGASPTQVPHNQQDVTTITSPDMLSETHKNETKMTQQPNLATPKTGKKATFLIGGFGDKRNIQKLKVWISAKGYSVYERPSGGLTLIGCEVNYETPTDLKKIGALLRNKFGEDVELIKR